MKKQLGELTLKELKEICDKTYNGCEQCPIKDVGVCYAVTENNLFNQEIEVEEKCGKQ